MMKHRDPKLAPSGGLRCTLDKPTQNLQLSTGHTSHVVPCQPIQLLAQLRPDDLVT